MENINALFVFECLLRDNTFMACIDNYISTIINSTKTFDAKNVPALVLLVMTLLTKSKSESYVDVGKNIKNDEELSQLLDIFYNYIIDRIKDEPELKVFDKKEFKISYDICVRLAVMKLKFKNKNTFSCLVK
jgi:hypothetical protein